MAKDNKTKPEDIKDEELEEVQGGIFATYPDSISPKPKTDKKSPLRKRDGDGIFVDVPLED